MPRRRDPSVPLRRHHAWDSDNVDPSGKSSVTVLLDWLTTPGNYERWRGNSAREGGQREKKEALCAEVVAAMRAHGILHRDTRSVRSKVAELERFYRAAATWLEQEGSVLLQGGDEAALEQAQSQVQKYCWCFFLLDPVFSSPPLWRWAAPTAPSAVLQDHSSAESALAPARTVAAVDAQSVGMSASQRDPELLELQKRKAQTELDILHTDLALKRVKLAEESLLTRKRLQDAGIPQAEVDTMLLAVAPNAT